MSNNNFPGFLGGGAFDSEEFAEYLRTRAQLGDRQIHWSIIWVQQFLAFARLEQEGGRGSSEPETVLYGFVRQLERRKDDNIVGYAVEAIQRYILFAGLRRGEIRNAKDGQGDLDASPGHGSRWVEQRAAYLRQTVQTLRLRHTSFRTEKAYTAWIGRFFDFLEREQAFGRSEEQEELGPDHLRLFLAWLAQERQVSKATQNQALNALLVLFRAVLGMEIEGLGSVLRAKPKRRLPVVCSRDEVRSIISRLDRPYSLMAGLLYGAGLRLEECLSLRTKDMDFGEQRIVVRSGKGDKDRVTLFPEVLFEPMKNHLEEMESLWERDRKAGEAGVALPGALGRKYPGLGREWDWFWVFPARGFCAHASP